MPHDSDHDDAVSRGFVVRDRRVSSEAVETESAEEPEAPPVRDAGGEPIAGERPPTEHAPRPPAPPADAPSAPPDGFVPLGDETELPPLTFGTFVLSLGTQVLVSLGLVPNPLTNQREKDLAGAKQTIDILEMLHEKTTGNLDTDEAQLLQDMLYDLRMKFVQVTKTP